MTSQLTRYDYPNGDFFLGSLSQKTLLKGSYTYKNGDHY